MTESLRIQLFGAFQLFRGDIPVTTLQSLQEQSLLAFLLLHKGASQSRQHLAFAFWPDSTEAQARSNLRKLLFRLRQDLPDADAFLYADTLTVQWLADAPCTLDVAEYEQALAAAQQEGALGHDAAECEALERAVALYGGELLPSCYDDWILPERTRLAQRFVRALERLQGLLEGQREYERAIGYAQRLLRYDPLYEPGYRVLMRLYALTGNRAAALRVYHECVTVLERELEVGPSPDTRQAYERLLRVEPVVESGTLSPAALAVSSSLVGRGKEWAALLAGWQAISAGIPRLLLVTGEAGIGKTRLAEELVRWVQRQGSAAATARCYAAEGGLAYAPVVEWLRAGPLPPLEGIWRRELARLLPELLVEDGDLVPPGPMSEGWQRQRLFEALARAVLGGRQPLLLLLDDMQWCDQDTLEWLHYLLRFDPGARLLVVATLRMEEVGEGQGLGSWLRAARRDVALSEIELGPLDEEETLALAADIAGQALDAKLEACLYAETEGNPLFVVEMVRAGGPSGVLDLACPSQGLPPRVQATIEGRLERLSAEAQEAMWVAATVGREFTYEVLAGASELNQDVLLRALDELWQRRVVRERGEEAYDFSHDKLREVAYASLSGVRRRLLHLRVAGALVAIYGEELGGVSGQVAAHYDRGGQPRQAIPYYLRAAEGAQQIYAAQEAGDYYERVLALIPSPVTGEENRWRLQALSGSGQVYLHMGRLIEAEERLREAIELGKGTASLSGHIARCYYWLGRALHQQSRYEEEARVGEEALSLLGGDRETVEAALILHAVATGYDYTGQREKARALWLQAAAFVEDLPYTEELGAIYQWVFSLYLYAKQADEAKRWLHVLETKVASRPDPGALGLVHQRMEDLLARQGDLRGAIAHLQQALAYADRTGDVAERDLYLWRLGLRSLSLGHVLKAEEYARTSLELKWTIGTTYHWLPWGYWLLGLILLCRGSWGEATEVLERAIAYARELGYPEHDLWANQLLGQMHLQHGDRAAARRDHQLAASLCTPATFRNWRAREIMPYAMVFASVLSGLEEAYADPEAFRAFCRQFPGRHSFSAEAERSPDLAQLALVQWFLEPAVCTPLGRPVLQETFDAPLSPAWTWHDPFGDCSHMLEEGLEIHAANGRDLWHINWSAPRLLCPLSALLGSGNTEAAATRVAVQAACVPAASDRPAIGGLLLWLGETNYVRLDRGMGGPHEISLLGCVDNQDMIVGRGRLPPEPSTGEGPGAPLERAYLRLEWLGDQVRALCSADGESWFTVGQIAFAHDRQAQFGVYAAGNIDRTIYHGAYPDGAAIRFESVQCWALDLAGMSQSL